MQKAVFRRAAHRCRALPKLSSLIGKTPQRSSFFPGVPFSTHTRPEVDKTLQPPQHSDFRTTLLEASLSKVSLHGWTQEAIAAAVCDLNKSNRPVSLASAGLITPAELVSYFMDRSNDELKKKLVEEKKTRGAGDSATRTVHNITCALQCRLDMLEELVQAHQWHQGMALGAQPDNVLQTKQQLAEMIDIVLDTEEQPFTFTERIGLGAVYVAAELHMLTDSSMEFQDTKEFLKQRVEGWDRVRIGLGGYIPSIVPPSDVMWTVGSALLSGAQSVLASNTVVSQNSGTRSSHYETSKSL